MAGNFSLIPFIDIPLSLQNGRYILREPPASVALEFLTKGTGPGSREFYKRFIAEYVTPAPLICEKLDVLREVQGVLSYMPFAGLSPVEIPLDPYLAALQEADSVGARYGICPFSVLEQYSLRALHLLFWAAHNAEIEQIKLQIKLAGGKADKIQRLRLKGELSEQTEADKWARAKELAKRRKAFYDRQKED